MRLLIVIVSLLVGCASQEYVTKETLMTWIESHIHAQEPMRCSDAVGQCREYWCGDGDMRREQLLFCERDCWAKPNCPPIIKTMCERIRAEY